ncbi:MAG: DUF3168 domain-containing protein [Pseudomonadota bacterium]
MTYALAWPLQQAVFALLSADAGVAALAAGRVYDAPPPMPEDATAEPPYAVIGDESVADWSAADCAGASHVIGVSVFASERSFGEAKRLAGAISDAMAGSADGAPSLSRGRIVHVQFLSARTRREERDRLRRIDLRFRVLVEDDA